VWILYPSGQFRNLFSHLRPTRDAPPVIVARFNRTRLDLNRSQVDGKSCYFALACGRSLAQWSFLPIRGPVPCPVHLVKVSYFRDLNMTVRLVSTLLIVEEWGGLFARVRLASNLAAHNSNLIDCKRG
jgi:hypothetical protein